MAKHLASYMQTNHSNHIVSDSKVAALFQNGSEEALDHFFSTYYPALCFFAARLTGDTEVAKDIASQAFIKTWEKHATLNTAAGIKAYLYQVARNDCYKWLHQQKRAAALHQDLGKLSQPVAQSHAEELIKAEFINTMYQHVKSMPAAQQTIFTKLYIEGKSVAETAAELNLHISTVKTQKARGILYLRKQFSI